MKRTMIALTVLAVVASFNAMAVDSSHVFDHAVSNLHNLQKQEAENIAHFNDVKSTDGTGRFNADGSWNHALAVRGGEISAARRAAEHEVNGTNYRNQVQQQQADAKAAAAYNRNATADKAAQQMQQEMMVDHASVASEAATANFNAQENAREQQAMKMSGMLSQPMATMTPSVHVSPLTPAVTVGVKTPVQSVPSVITNMPVVVSNVPFSTARGNGGNKGSHASRGGSDNRGSDNAHSSAFGGHGYGHDNSRSEGFGGHSHFH